MAEVRKAWTQPRAYPATLAARRELSDRELADIGISRHVIRDIARDAIDGK
jgi:uncharacterized protein YjiS (DUF1127 family)